MNAITPVGDTSAARFSPTNDNLRIWNAEERTDPKFTKEITGKSYRGTSPNPTYIVKRLTAAFGPVGWGWGYRVLRFEEVVDGDAAVNFAHIEFWYYPFGRADAAEQRRAVFEQVGATQLAYTTSKGKRMVDEDARKKSLTDAITKAASHIGIAGDIFLGRYDDSKYVAELRQDEARSASPIAFVEAAGGAEKRFLGVAEWRAFWRDRLKVMAEDKNLAAAEPLFEANKAYILNVAAEDEAAAQWVTGQLARMAEAARKQAEAPEGEADGVGDTGGEGPPDTLPLARSDGTVDHAKAKNGLLVETVWLSWVRARVGKAGDFGQLQAWWDRNGQNIGLVQRWFPDTAAAAAKAYTDGLARLSDFPGDRDREPALEGAK